jgi:RNA polymerase sigma-70 factor (ECF subfamily)
MRGVRTVSDFEAYVVARTPALLRYAYVLTGDAARAEDLVQGSLASAYRHWRRIGADPDAYVRRSVLNAYLNQWRRVLRREFLVDRLPERSAPVVDVEERDVLWRALSLLPPRQRAVVVLRFYEDLDVASTAALLEISPGTVKSQTSKALASLRSSLRPEVVP